MFGEVVGALVLDELEEVIGSVAMFNVRKLALLSVLGVELLPATSIAGASQKARSTIVLGTTEDVV